MSTPFNCTYCGKELNQELYPTIEEWEEAIRIIQHISRDRTGSIGGAASHFLKKLYKRLDQK